MKTIRLNDVTIVGLSDFAKAQIHHEEGKEDSLFLRLEFLDRGEPLDVRGDRETLTEIINTIGRSTDLQPTEDDLFLMSLEPSVKKELIDGLKKPEAPANRRARRARRA